MWLTLPDQTAAVGISVSPPSLELRGEYGKKITGTFSVINPSRETIIYEITNDGLLPLVITPTTFLLEPNESANVTVDYHPNDKLTTNKLSATQLSILGRPLTVNPTQAASGVKLPVSIQVGTVAGASTARFDPLTIGLIIMNGLLLLWLAYLVFKRHLKPLPLKGGESKRSSESF